MSRPYHPMDNGSSGRKCDVAECGRPHIARGLCGKHYQRARTGAPEPRSLVERFWAKVDRSGECWLWTAFTGRDGYGYFSVGMKRRMAAHRFSYELHNTAIPPGMDIDHMCHVRACVNPSHLRVCTRKQNLENRAGADSDSKSGVRGVSWRKDMRKWQAKVRHNGRDYWVGLFFALEEAEAAVIAKRNALFTHNDMDRAA